AALDAAVECLRCRTAVHICYGYGIKANNDWKQTLGGEWRQYEQTFPLLARSRIGGVSLECAAARVTWPATQWRRPPRWPPSSARASNTSSPSASSPAPIAGWCRWPATSRSASSTRSPPAPRWSARSSAPRSFRLGDLDDPRLHLVEALRHLGIVARDHPRGRAGQLVDALEALEHLREVGDDLHGVPPLDIPVEVRGVGGQHHGAPGRLHRQHLQPS